MGLEKQVSDGLRHQAESGRGRAGSDQTEATTLDGGRQVGTHLWQKIGPCACRVQLEAHQVRDQVHEDPVVLPFRGTEIRVGFVERRQRQQPQCQVRRVVVTTISLVQGRIQKALQQPHTGTRAPHIADGRANVGEHVEQLCRHKVLAHAQVLIHNGCIRKPVRVTD